MESKVIEIVAGLAKYRQIPVAVRLNNPQGGYQQTIRGIVAKIAEHFMLLSDTENLEHIIYFNSVDTINVTRI